MANVLLGATLSYLTANHWMVSGSSWTMEYPASRNSATSASFPICATRGARIPYFTGVKIIIMSVNYHMDELESFFFSYQLPLAWRSVV